MTSQTVFTWSHVAHGEIARSVDLDCLIECMKQEDYPEPNYDKLRQAMHLGDEYEYCACTMKVIKTIGTHE